MRRVARISAGMAMVTAGTVMIFTPGPGLLAIAGGLALMKDDVAWAGRASDWVKEKATRTLATQNHEVSSEPETPRSAPDSAVS